VTLRSLSYCPFPVMLLVGGWVGLSTPYISNLFKDDCSGVGESRIRNRLMSTPSFYHETSVPNSGHNITCFLAVAVVKQSLNS